MKKTMPFIGILIAVAFVPSIIGALLGTKGTGAFVIDLLLFGPIIPIVALSIILWLLGNEPQESPRPAKEAEKEDEEEAEEEEPAPPAPKEKQAEEPSEPEDEESAPVETEEEAEKETSKDVESVCPTCGSAVSLEDEYCPHCGAEFENEEDEGKKSDDSD